MIYLRIQFVAGRFHATPWAAHVNEGAAEWPPSPWRILRALLSVGFTHLHWHPNVPDEAISLVNKLVTCEPQFALPPSIQTHTRHYMPVHEGAKVNSAKVFDTCVRISSEMPVWVKYDTDLTTAEYAKLTELAEHIPYLGRAESWVDVSVHREVADVESWTSPATDTSASLGSKIVRVLAGLSPEQYAAWRAKEVERTIIRFIDEKGKRPTAKQNASLQQAFPSDMVECLLGDTVTLQKLGWSQPPGSRWVDYLVSDNSCEIASRRTFDAKNHRYPTAGLLALTSDSIRGRTLPPHNLSVLVGEKLHQACVAQLTRFADNDREASTFTGRNENGTLQFGHLHAHFIPLCLQGNRMQIDHVLLYAKQGFGPLSQTAIANVPAIYSAGLPKTLVTLLGFGDLPQVRSVITKITRSSDIPAKPTRVFRSVTPYVATRHLRRNYGLEENVADECRFRGLPIARIAEQVRNAGRFRLVRNDDNRKPPKPEGWMLTLEFEEPIDESQSPLSLGYASHFGLGLFQSV